MRYIGRGSWGLLVVVVFLIASAPFVYAAFLAPVEIIDSTGDGGGNTLDSPRGVAVDTTGNVYVIGFSTDNAFKITPGGTITEIIDSTGDGGGNTLTGPIGIAVDTTGNVYVTGLSTDNAFKIPFATASSGGGSASKHKTLPIFGIDPTTFRQLIEGGFGFNGITHDITDNFWTPFPEQEVKIGETNSYTTKVFASQKLRVQEFLFGIPVVGEAHNAELGVEIHYNHDGTIKETKVIQKTDIVDVDSLKVTTSESKCRSDDADKRCVTTTILLKFLESLKDKIMAIKAIDFKNRVQITYLNEGFDISGNSLNPMNTKMIPSTEKFEGLVEVTQTAKYSGIWVTQDGREFEMNTSGSFAQINQSFDRHIDTGVMKNRLHSEFADYKETQADNAITQLLEYCPTCLMSYADFKDSWAYEYTEKVDRLEILYYNMMIEERKAIKVLDDAQLDIAYPKAEIDRDDRPISIILAEERAMKKLLADERAYLKQVLAPQQ